MRKGYILLIWIILFTHQSRSQQTDPCDLDPFCEDPDGMEEVPLDGGLGFLIAAGLLYGSKRIAELKKSRNPD